MPVILTQHYSPADRIYQDVEYCLYHYPRQYYGRVRPGDRFIYYRPLGRSTPRADSKTYYGCGLLGQWWPDAARPDHRFVALRQADAFPKPVPIFDLIGAYYETESAASPAFQSAVRDITETAYWKILAAAGVKAAELSLLPDTEFVQIQNVRLPLAAAPLDDFREITAIPPGAGYKRKGDTRVNVYESAALQERARADHQDVLRLIQQQVLRRGGVTLYNNNLVQLHAAVDRMRYGIGQLADYDFRYRAELQGAGKVLAFGALPSPGVNWIADVLENERIAFVARDGGEIVALNSGAEALHIFDQR